MSSVTIKTKDGRDFIISEEDFNRVSQFNWTVRINGRKKDKGYKGKEYIGRRTTTHNRRQIMILLHRFIMEVEDPKLQVDHKNGNTFDNRRENLRICTNSQNSKNRIASTIDNKVSKYKGVSKDKSGKWYARIRVEYKTICSKLFISEVQAAQAYDELADKYHGEYAKKNFK